MLVAGRVRVDAGVVERLGEGGRATSDRLALVPGGCERGDELGDVGDGDLVDAAAAQAEVRLGRGRARPGAVRVSRRRRRSRHAASARRPLRASATGGRAGSRRRTSGTRNAASSPTIQILRVVASRLVLNEPRVAELDSRPPSRYSTPEAPGPASSLGAPDPDARHGRPRGRRVLVTIGTS